MNSSINVKYINIIFNINKLDVKKYLKEKKIKKCDLLHRL